MLTQFLTDELLDHVFRNAAYTSPTTVYGGLLSAVTAKEAGTVTEASYSGYARQAITFAAPDASQGGRRVRNSAQINFPQKGDAGTVNFIGVGVYDALTAGNLLGVTLIAPLSPVLATAATTDTLTAPAHGMANDQRVRVEAVPGGTIPTGLSEDTEYWVVSSATDTFQLSATQGGAAVNVTAAGSCIILPYTPVPVSQNDTPQIAANALSLLLD